ncbi:hypothetical protein N7454_007025 [Penicillium verhagenii]|nr:hypothetical protein N7454_007025 [Penicillium verhagenii]
MRFARLISIKINNSATDGRAYWPERKLLPSTENLWLGRIIEGCWNGESSSAQSLLQALNETEEKGWRRMQDKEGLEEGKNEQATTGADAFIHARAKRGLQNEVWGC